MKQDEKQVFFHYPHRGVNVQGGPMISSLYTVHFFSGAMDYAIPGEIHPFWEMIYMDSGSIDLKGEGWQTTLKEGDLLLIEPDRPHSFSTRDEQMYSLFIMSFACTWEGMRAFEGLRVFQASFGVKRLIGDIVKQARQNFLYPLDRISADQMRLKKTADSDCLQSIRRLCELILLRIGREDEKEPVFPTEGERLDAHPSIRKSVQYLRQHADGGVTLNQLCAYVGVSPSHLQNMFKRDMGITVMQYYRLLRIGKAKYMIRQQKYTMTEIAEACGFSSVHHFSTCFRLLEHMSPSRYASTVKKWLDGESAT